MRSLRKDVLAMMTAEEKKQHRIKISKAHGFDFEKKKKKLKVQKKSRKVNRK